MTNFRCVAADPPWQERGGGRIKRGADRHYALLAPREIWGAMTDSPFWSSVENARGCHLWMWTTDNFLLDALNLGDALGFRYIRTMVWVKTLVRDEELRQENVRTGLGQYLRGSHELCLLFVRGKSMVPPPARRMRSVVVAQRGRHSEKPAEAFEVFESVSPGPRLEMFARAPRPGWTTWGNEVDA